MEQQEEVDLERLDLVAGEHFTVVIGADHHCIQQLNFVTSKGRVRVSQYSNSPFPTSGAWTPNYRKWTVLFGIFAPIIHRLLHGEFGISSILSFYFLIARLVSMAPASSPKASMSSPSCSSSTRWRRRVRRRSRPPPWKRRSISAQTS